MILSLPYGLAFADLYERDGLVQLDGHFLDALKTEDVGLYNQLMEARAEPDGLEEKAHSTLLIDLAPHVERFIAQLFSISDEVEALIQAQKGLDPLYSVKRLFVQRRALRAYKAAEAEGFDAATLREALEQAMGEPFDELSFARAVTQWLEDETAHDASLDLALRYSAWASQTEAGQALHGGGILFTKPKKLDFDHLVPVETVERDGIRMLKLPDHELRRREGFALTDDGASLAEALDEANYCIYCHNQGKDSCSKGLRDKEGRFKESPTRVTLAGCPLEEKISEMNMLKAQAVPLGALAVVTIDNPMCAGTGHRICNDCMKSCIYQKQDPVDIPQMETRTLKDILHLPWGFEIYSLLTRWNPLNIHRPLPKAETGHKVLVAGLGPAGYTLAHHLMNDGHTVVGIDGLKIEPLPPEISGVSATGELVPFAPIRDVTALYENLDTRSLAGFGGVAEYGITVRWNKNYLKLIRLLLERRRQFAMFGGVRMGGTVTVEQAWQLGFDHIALCMGAGKPRILDIPNGLANGVRTASDFLMALQLTGAAKSDSIANLTLRLPVVVIGGGLTAIDTATESLAYYPVQVEKFLRRYEALVKERGEAAVQGYWSAEERETAEEWIAHARAIREERHLATKEGREPNILALLRQWGGVHLLYRRSLQDAPSYRLNHEEVELALQEGIEFAEHCTPKAVEIDQYGAAKGLTVAYQANAEQAASLLTVPARTILVAAGTQPNTVLQREDPVNFEMDGKYFAAMDEAGQHASPEWVAKPEVPQVLTQMEANGNSISYFGDLHPSFAGNVVKAMGSAKQGYPTISRILAKKQPANRDSSAAFVEQMRRQFIAVVADVIRLTPTIIEVVVHAPLAARNFDPGQFYRLQNYDGFALKGPDGTLLAMEGLALTGASVDKEKGLLSTIVLEMGGSSDLCAYLKKGEPVILMGPTGTPTEIPTDETVMLVGGGLGNAVLFSIGKACREAGNKVLYFAGYKKNIDRYKLDEIEAAADVVVWCCDEAPDFEARRPQDHAFHGNIVEAMVAYQNGSPSLPLTEVDRIIAIGSDRMMAAVAEARHTALKPWLKDSHLAIGSINSPMQCMMKEICAQCLQQHVDPETGEKSYVFSCFNQDQPLDCVSFPHLRQRLGQNSLQEKLTAQWIDRALTQMGERTLAA